MSGLLLTLACLLVGSRLAEHLQPRAEAHLHLARTLSLAIWTGLGWTTLVLALGLYDWRVAVGSALLGLLGARGGLPRLREVLGEVRAEARSWSPVGRALALTWLAWIAVSVGRVVAFLPHGWDALSYHLVHAGRWVRDGAVVRDPAPDAWSYYEYVATGGDVLTSWFMLDSGTSDLLVLPALLAHLAAFAATWAAARAVGHGSDRAVVLTVVVVGTPALLTWASSLYVDVWTLVLAALAVVHAVQFAREGRGVDALALGCAVAGGIAVKNSSLLWVGLLVAAPLLARRRPDGRTALALLGPLVLLVPGWVELAVRFGNPLYPVDLPGLGRGNPALRVLMAGALTGEPATLPSMLKSAAIQLVSAPPSHAALTNGWLVVPLGLVGLLRRNGPRDARVVLALVALPVAAIFVNPSTWYLLTGWRGASPASSSRAGSRSPWPCRGPSRTIPRRACPRCSPPSACSPARPSPSDWSGGWTSPCPPSPCGRRWSPSCGTAGARGLRCSSRSRRPCSSCPGSVRSPRPTRASRSSPTGSSRRRSPRSGRSGPTCGTRSRP